MVLLIILPILIVSIFLPFKRVGGLYPWNMVYGMFFAIWLLQTAVRRGEKLKGKKVFGFFLPLLIIMVFAMIRQGKLFWFKEHFVAWLQIPLTYMITINIIRTRKDFHILLYAVTATIAIFSVFYIINRCYLSTYHVLRGGDLHFVHRNMIASQIGIFLFLLAGMIFGETSATRRNALLGTIAVGLVALSFTASRWGIASCLFVLCILTFFCFSRKEAISRNRYLLFFIGVCMASLIYMYFFGDRHYAFLLSLRPQTLKTRIELWKVAVMLFQQHPLVGIGMGYFGYCTYYSDTHNIMLEVLVATGLLGLGAFLYLIAKLTQYFRNQVRICQSQERYLLFAGIASYIFFFIRNMSDYHMEHSLGIQLGIVLAVIELANAFAADKSSHTSTASIDHKLRKA